MLIYTSADGWGYADMLLLNSLWTQLIESCWWHWLCWHAFVEQFEKTSWYTADNCVGVQWLFWPTLLEQFEKTSWYTADDHLGTCVWWQWLFWPTLLELFVNTADTELLMAVVRLKFCIITVCEHILKTYDEDCVYADILCTAKPGVKNLVGLHNNRACALASPNLLVNYSSAVQCVLWLTWEIMFYHWVP